MPPYNDHFRETNMQYIRHILKQNNVIQSMQWQSDLRHWHPDRVEVPKEGEGDSP